MQVVLAKIELVLLQFKCKQHLQKAYPIGSIADYKNFAAAALGRNRPGMGLARLIHALLFKDFYAHSPQPSGSSPTR